MYPYDPEYVQEMQTLDFDAHCDLGVLIGLLTQQEADRYKELDKLDDEGNLKEGSDVKEYKRLKKKRGVCKIANYSATYGTGAATLSRSTGVSIEEAEKVLKGYWERNWSLKAFEKDCKVKRTGQHHWVLNPVNGFWYLLKNEKDIFSTVNQGTGAYCFDIVSFFLNAEEKKGQFHDEEIDQIIDSEEEKVRFKRKLELAVKSANNFLSLNVELSTGLKFGYNYMKIH